MKEKSLRETLKQEVDLPAQWVNKYGTEDAMIARFRKARQEAIRDKIAEQDHEGEIMRCFNLLETIDETDTHAHILMAKVKMKFDMHHKMLNKYVGDVKSVEMAVNGSSGGSEARGVSRAVEILGELASRGLERDITPPRKDRSVVSTQIPDGSEGHGAGSQPGLVVREDEGSTIKP